MANTKKAPQTFWGIQSVLKTKARHLAFKHKDGNLYFCIDKRPPAPILFSTKKDAEKAIDKFAKAKISKEKLRRMFSKVIKAEYSEAVKVNVSFN